MAFHALSATILLQGISGVAGGYALLADPSGDLIGLPLSWLEGTPFSDYFVPGFILFSVLGVCPLAVAWGLWRRRPWAWRGSLLVGTGLAIWILVEIVMIGYQPAPPLQAFYGSLSLVILSLSSARSVRQRLLGRERDRRV
jgi:peptidoglycan/LPS O-acetylase OafA/YrhL